jgi:DNA-binding NarL/FixJ family response regulator
MNLEILTLSPQDKQLFVGFSDKVSQILDMKFQFQFVRDLKELPQFFYSHNDPAVVFFDMTAGGFGQNKAEDMKQLFYGIRKLDPSACIVLIVDFHPNSEQVMDWMDRGASGILDWNFDPKLISESLWDLLATRMSLKRGLPRSPTRHKIQIKYSTLEQALVAETLNIGFGGFFVNTVIAGAVASDVVDFEFLKSDMLSDGSSVEVENHLVNKINDTIVDEASSICGVGKIVWLRARDTPDSPRGMGIQFVEIAENHKKWIEEFVRKRRVYSFIPKN